MSNIKYSEGDAFAVPLRGGGFARGVVTRVSKQGKILIGYFFGPKLNELPGECDSLSPIDAVKIFRCGDLGLISGEWPLIGKISDWDRSLWPSPQFLREDPIVKKAWLVTYADDEPSVESRVDPCPIGLTQYERAGLAGSGVVEINLSKTLS